MGIIPAYAGSTFGTHRVPIDVSDHPRIRGEHRWTRSPSLSKTGSSPHTRGAPDRGEKDRGVRRIIPAYAGSTGWADTGRFPRRDHPRIRGEHESGQAKGASVEGSSPHTRGAHDWLEDFADRPGIIPAYAGSTSTAPAVS